MLRVNGLHQVVPKSKIGDSEIPDQQYQHFQVGSLLNQVTCRNRMNHVESTHPQDRHETRCLRDSMAIMAVPG